jgi:chromate transporter
MAEPIRKTWGEIARGFLKVGATAFGGPAIMGVMQVEFQDRRQWVSRPRFLEGLALVNVLPGATATQLGIFLGHARGGWWGGALAGLCLVAPGFVVMLGLTERLRTLGWARAAMEGLMPAVIGVMAVTLGRMAPIAAPDRLAIGMFVVAALATLRWRVAPLRAMLGGSLLGVVRDRLCEMPGVRALLCHAAWGR